MNEQENIRTNTSRTSSQEAMADLWEQHLRDEFELRDVDKTMETMVADPYNTAIPIMTGGVGGGCWSSTPNGSSHRTPRI